MPVVSLTELQARPTVRPQFLDSSPFFKCTWINGQRSGKRCRRHGAAKAKAMSSPSTHQEVGETTEYLTWAKDAGINFTKITQSYFDGDLRGCRAVEAIQPNEIFVTVPRASALIVDPNARCPCPDFVSKEYWKQAPWFIKMTVLLLHETSKGRQSSVWGYIAQLPKSIDTPVRWSDAELDELQYKRIKDKIIEQRKQWGGFFNDFKSASVGLAGQSVTWDQFLSAAENVRSRAFSGPYAGAPLAERLRLGALVAVGGLGYAAWSHLPLTQLLNGALAAAVFNLLYDVILSSKLKWYALCPIIDSINHSSRVDSKVEFEYFRDCIVASTGVGWNPGQQVFISYGPQTNDSLFQYYGFVEDNNSHDMYNLFAIMDNGENIELIITAKGIATDESLASLRGKLGKYENEQTLYKALLSMLETELGGKATSVADDLRLMRASHLASQRVKAATLFRLEKKRILLRAIERVKKKLSKLEQ